MDIPGITWRGESIQLKERAKQLRNESTLSEVLLWNELKQKKMKGYDFHRQKPIDHYIVDFYCPRLMLAIEIDGETHAGRNEKDEQRQARLQDLGVHFLRFDDLDVKFRMSDVLQAIERWIGEQTGGEQSQLMHTPCPASAGHPSDRGE